MRALLITEDIREQIRALIAYADTHRLDRAAMLALRQGRRPPPGDDWHYRLGIADGYRCIYSIDATPIGGWARHLSVSVDTLDKTPSPQAMALLCHEFGFSAGLVEVLWCEGRPAPGQTIMAHQGQVWLETIPPAIPGGPSLTAINVSELLDWPGRVPSAHQPEAPAHG